MSQKLTKELDRVHKKTVRQEQKKFDGDTILNDAKQLLLEAHNDDIEMLERIGLDHQVKYSKELQSDATRSKLAQERYDQVTYTGEEIKQLCNTYDLRMLPARYYNGSIPVDLARKVKEFETQNEVQIRQSSLYILAPTSQFNTIEDTPVQTDPILFYKVDSEHGSSREEEADENDRFVNVHNWGNDFTFLRKYRWLINTRVNTDEGLSNASRSIIIGLLFLITLAFNIWSGQKELIIAVNVLFMIFFACIINNNHTMKVDTLNHLWNTNRR